MNTTTPPAWSERCKRCYRVTETGAWCFVSMAKAQEEHAAARGAQYVFVMQVWLGILDVLDTQRRAPRVRQAIHIETAPRDGAIRTGPTPAEARHLDRVEQWFN